MEKTENWDAQYAILKEASVMHAERIKADMIAAGKFPKKSVFHQIAAAVASQRRVVIIHDNDLDGWCGGAAIEFFITENFNSTVEMKPIGHGNPFNTFIQELPEEGPHRDAVIFVIDLEVDKEALERLCLNYEEVVVIDHHPDTYSDNVEQDFPTAVVVSAEGFTVSSALLSTLIVSEMDRDAIPSTGFLAAAATDIYDCWRFGKEYGLPWMVQVKLEALARQIAAVGFKHGYVGLMPAFFVPLFRSSLSPVERSVQEIATMGQAIIEDIALVCDSVSKRYCQILEGTVLSQREGESHVNLDALPVTYALVFHSEHMDAIASHILTTAATKVDFVAVVQVKPNGNVKLCLRSKKTGANVGLIAKAYGGGGHATAAGVEMSLQMFTVLLLSAVPLACKETK